MEPEYKILLVEDSAIVMMAHRGMLEQFGCHVDVAEDGNQALTMAQQPYDLIFMDLGLPYLSGIEVTCKLRQSTKHQTVPIVGLTACYLADVEQECLTAGMNQVLGKPTTTAELEQVIRSYVPR
jgi:CheY-like chemotaxis protein